MIEPQAILDPIDKVLHFIWHKPLRLLCAVTGKSNFFFARTLMWLSAGLSIYIAISGIFVSFVLTFLSGFLGWSSVVVIQKRFTNIEARHNSNPEYFVGPIYDDIFARCLMSVSAAPPVIISLKGSEVMPSALMVFLALAIWTWAGSIYWLFDIQPPRKSAWSKAVDWLKAHRPHWSPSAPPSPFPA